MCHDAAGPKPCTRTGVSKSGLFMDPVFVKSNGSKGGNRVIVIDSGILAHCYRSAYFECVDESCGGWTEALKNLRVRLDTLSRNFRIFGCAF
jgi:hypothetical protein